MDFSSSQEMNSASDVNVSQLETRQECLLPVQEKTVLSNQFRKTDIDWSWDHCARESAFMGFFGYLSNVYSPHLWEHRQTYVKCGLLVVDTPEYCLSTVLSRKDLLAKQQRSYLPKAVEEVFLSTQETLLQSRYPNGKMLWFRERCRTDSVGMFCTYEVQFKKSELSHPVPLWHFPDCSDSSGFYKLTRILLHFPPLFVLR